MFVAGKAEIVEEYDKTIRSPSLTLRVPAIIRLIQTFRRHTSSIRFSKRNVFARDRMMCQYCGVKDKLQNLTFDHIIPKSKGGKTNWYNCITCCKDCNIKKGDKSLEDCGLKLLSKPFKPSWVPSFLIHLNKNSPHSWKDYCWGMSE